MKDGKLEYYCNTLVSYSLRGVHAKLNVIWDWEPPAGIRRHAFRLLSRHARADRGPPGRGRGSGRSSTSIPADAAAHGAGAGGRQGQDRSAAGEYPGVAVEDRGAEIHIAIPEVFRVGHEAHFAQVTGQLPRLLRDRPTLPAWERPNMLAKYFVTTTGTELSRQGPSRPAPRIAR